MFSSTFTLTALTLGLASFVGTASAAVSNDGLTIFAPGGDNLWWIVDADNTLIWSCAESTVTQFTVWINNSDTSLLSAITQLLSVEPNYDCSQTISANVNTAPVGTGYTIVLTDITNNSNIYAATDPFEIKALSAGYPPASNTPTDSASATVQKTGSIASGTGTAGATAASASTTKSSTASTVRIQVAGVLAAAAAIAAFVL
ncbi:hypothetical protein DFH07DRAFT_843769 [Mycena maculata]|uniref:Uncharacterized protein n=1 Tax=Mycena maculata TaxID=230809 RepID=A0AAD7I5J5_9AGAR|nr:hypothetical protein DFH07DRAFT_843769 [Mycena maculata]